MKQINLRTMMFLKIIPILLLLAYYHMLVRSHYNSFDRMLPSCLSGILVVLYIFLRKREKEIIDERAKDTLKMTNSICFNITFIMLIVIMFILGVGEFSSIKAGYFISISLLSISFVRAVIFCVLDKKGE